jgi:hypothetical protein
MESEHANTLNNLAFELALIGNYDKAQAFIRDALRLREKAGPRVPVGLSLNTIRIATGSTGVPVVVPP